MKQRTGYETVCLISGLRVCHLISGDGVWPMFGPPRPRSNLCEPPRFGRQGAMGQGPPCALIKLSNPTSCRNRGRSGVWRRRGSGSTVYPDRVHRSGDAEMAATSTLVAAAAIITLVALTTRAEAQSLSPYYGPDGRMYYRRANPAIPQQPYAAPQTVPAPTTTAPAPRAQKVKVKPKPKPKPDTPKPAVVAAPEPTVAVPAIKADPPAPSPIEPKEVKPHPLAEWCGQEGNAKAPLCRNLGSSRVQR